ncbi:CyP450 monooxygenase [Mycena kentingensis (nom. inval.)]|nr:CyP450 monooxygenase [Mycena kentingensis (nom. inval.)]
MASISSLDLRSLALYSTIGLLATLYIKKAVAAWRANPRHLPYPPGPRSLPLVGNALSIPQSDTWLTYQEWGRQYGPLVYLTAFGDEIILINSAKVADDLLEKRSALYSDRPQNPINPLMGWEANFALMAHGPLWRKHRRLMHQFFKKDSAILFHPVQAQKIHDMLRQLLHTPSKFMDHIRTLTGALVLKTMYGYDVKPAGDPIVELAEDSVTRTGQVFFSTGYMLPWIRFLPRWMPGGGFGKFVADTQVVVKNMQEVPYQYAKENLLQGKDSNSVVAQMLETGRGQEGAVDEEMLQSVAAVLYSAAADTSSSALGTFFLAMALHPDVQKKAQAQIDTVVGHDRLPNPSDRDQLPYVEAIYREVLRWKPPVVLSLPHGTTEDDIYDGYFIPKGAIVVPNIWAMCYDESIFPHPEQFTPERFLAPTSSGLTDDPRMDTSAFGHGRRICPGRYFARDAVWMTIASVLSAFEVRQKKGVEILGKYTDKFIIHPLPFECDIVPRSEGARALVEATAEHGFA